MTAPEEFLRDGAETYAEKNQDYGDSWRLTGNILHQMAGGEPVTLESPQDWIMVGLYTRRLDKFLRSFNGEFRADELNFESIVDTHADESVYAAMAAALASDVEENLVASGSPEEGEQ